MKTISCSNCGSIWKAEENFDICPKCGKGIYVGAFQNMKGKVGKMKNIVEIRSASRLIDGPCYITLFFDDQTQSIYEESFKNHEIADAFIKGIRSGFDWAERGVKLQEE